MLIYRGCFLFKYWHMQRKSWIHHLCSQKYFTQWYSYQSKRTGFELPFPCCESHIRKQMYVKGAGKMYQASPSSPTSKMNQIASSKQYQERIHRPDTAWLFKWKEVKRILKEYIFIIQLCVFPFFSWSFKINRMTISIFVENNNNYWLAQLSTVYCSFFIFLEG